MKCPSCETKIDLDGYIPKERFDDVLAKRKEAETELAALRPQATLAEKLQEKLDASTRTLEQRDRHDALRDALSQSVPDIADPSIRDIFESQYARLPEEGRPKFADWAQALAEKADERPKALSYFFTAQTQTQTTDRKTEYTSREAGARKGVDTNAERGMNSGNQEMSADDIRGMSTEEYVARRKTIWEQAGLGDPGEPPPSYRDR